jgi:uncharacterized protein
VRAVRRGIGSWFLPGTPDVLGLLVLQGNTTATGMAALERWAAGERAAADEVRAAEHAADEARRATVGALRQAFLTPLEPEDLYSLSERLDRVMNQAKDLVREAEVLDMDPDEPMAEMAKLARAGVEDLVDGFSCLGKETDRATAAADRAIRRQRAIERVYRSAMSVLLHSDQMREVAGRRELYRRCSRLGDGVEHVADRIWYAVVKRA